MCSKTASSLRWHEEERSKDGKLRHPADGEAWKEFDKRPPDFALDSRNIILGLSSNGFNPFRTTNVSHSTWPVLLIPYNFPPWCCMKAKYSMLSLLIPGPQSPENNIDVYLQPLIEELKVLWDLGVETYDASLKQTFQMRANLQDMGIRKKLHLKELDQGKKIVFAKACFSMTAKEKTTFCSVLKKAKIPDGCASNISKCVQLAERKVSGYKSHDAHFMLHYLLQVAVRSAMSNQKVIEVADLDILQTEIVETLCQLETIFPPSFFDIMVHLPIHLVNEVILGRPAQFRWMYFTERYLGKLKSYVRNKSRPEGSIAEGYLVEECLTFCSRYLHSGVETRFSRMTRNSDTCDLGHPIGGKKKGEGTYLDCNEHENEDVNVNKIKRWSKAKSQGLDFVEWFKKRALLSDVSDKLKKLSRGPNKISRHFSGYVINGYRFHTKHCDARRKTQNSGVTLMAVTKSFASTKDENPIVQSIAYYGSITEIVEVDYYGMLKFVLFRCDWFEVEEDKFGLTCVYFNKRCYMDDPFVLASQVHQCFYIQDPSNPNRHYVMKSIPMEFFNLNEQSNSNGQQPYQCDSSDHPINLAASDETREVEFVRNDIPPTIIVNSLRGSDEKESDDDSSFDETHLDYFIIH
ncbi:uncharacterized protein [Cicer arietinum]|uniref:uncharacterized protein n=1 Tax=Cicer arietinum TaxID=3827 RepID=UPI003CC5A1F0